MQRSQGCLLSRALGGASQQSLNIGMVINTSTRSIPQLTLGPFQVPGLMPDATEQSEIVIEQIRTQINSKMQRALRVKHRVLQERRTGRSQKTSLRSS